MKFLLLMCVLIGSFCSFALAEDRQATEEDLKVLKQEMDKLNQWLQQVSKQKDGLQEKLKSTEISISDNLAEIERLQQELEQLKKQIAELQSNQTQLRQALEKKRQNIEQLVVASYQQGRQSQLKMLLSQQNPNDLRRMLNYATWLSESQQHLLTQYQSDLTELQHTEQALDDKSEQLRKSNQRLVEDNQRLKQQQNERTQLLAKLNQQIASGSQRLVTMKEDRARLEELLKRMNESLQSLVPIEMDVPFANVQGQLGWPAQGKVTHRFGERLGAGPLTWDGILIAAKEGAGVTAVHHGRVVFADWLKGFGLLIILDHGDGFMSLYGRNEVLLRSVGEWVNKGDLLARAGDSGLEEPGVYFEIRYQGKPRNPAKWLAKQ
ncbi:murein hydrolase activator EnvC family protein [Gynuella sunshinyii]|uniref:Membrane-bound metallopeptidase n=1 Tax=Gynuella sunshinyii YC6258 TaxID=1445510 RepID=A0A0C5VIE0_9GAMM|nr:peptidoglycan DD-metalloendopeptidase family protein [Gynuella sunshinyii]AJQ94031.1 membrane-bound metallopeptidase [Gynuella sunshinyii YC6258]